MCRAKGLVNSFGAFSLENGKYLKTGRRRFTKLFSKCAFTTNEVIKCHTLSVWFV